MFLTFSSLAFAESQMWIADVKAISIVEDPQMDERARDRIEKELNASYIGHPFTKEDAQELKRVVTQEYVERGLLVESVSIPEQDVTNGSLLVKVETSRLGSVKFAGNDHFSSQLLEKYFRTKEGEEIQLDRFVSDLAWMNRNPFRRTGAVFSEGSAPGTKNVEFITQDRRPYYFYYGWDDRGNDSIGVYRQFAGFTWGKLFGFDQTLSYQFTNSAWNSHLLAHVVSYDAPLPWRHELSIYGAYSEVRSKKFDQFFRNVGKSAQGSMRYTIPIIWSDKAIHEVIFGTDYKFTDNNLQFSEIPLFSRNTALLQFSLEWNVELKPTSGTTRFRAKVVGSPIKSWLPHQTESDYETLRPYSEVRYVYGQAELERNWILPRGFCLKFRALGQAASTNLLPSEQFGLGGMDTVRGYEERIFNGDFGALANLQLSLPSFSFFKRLCSECSSCTPCSIIPTPPTPRVMDRLTFYAFCDYGVGMVHKAITDSKKSENLVGAGPGLLYAMDPYMNLQLDWGFRLHKVQLEDSLGGRLHFQWIGRF